MTSPRLRLSLDALAENYRALRQRGSQRVAPDQASAVVKANAYGLGLSEVASRLWQEGCRRFFVAVADEGVQLRQLLPQSQIFVLAGATAETMRLLKQHALVPVLNTVHQCALWASEPELPAALHIDTGMHRLGLPSDMDLSKLPPLNLALVMTHFARADERGHAMTAQQRQLFSRSLASLHPQHENFLISANNTAGALSENELGDLTTRWLDRLGIGLYGVNPQEETQPTPGAQPFQPVATLEGQVLQVRSANAGAEVGYGATYRLQNAGRLATIGVGYADGVPRLLSNQGQVYWQGHMLAVVGRVSMDSIVVELPDDCSLSEGHWVEVFGANIPVERVARQANTISYEILTGIGPRVRRVS